MNLVEWLGFMLWMILACVAMLSMLGHLDRKGRQ